MSVTLKDIAERVGVSVNTVSHALKDKPDIGEQTKARVREAARNLGYRPNFNARSLVLKKTFTIGLAMTESDNPVRMEFCERLRRLLASDGYGVLAVSLSQSWDRRDVSAVDDLLSRGVDGMILGSVWRDGHQSVLDGILQECAKSSTPVVLFGQSDSALADCVEIDFSESAYRLTRYLLSRGEYDIAYGCLEDSARSQGYQRAMEEAGLQAQVLRLDLASHGLESAYRALSRYLERGGHLPGAIIAANDLGALGMLAALREHGIRVPEECSVVGMDNIAFGNYSAPQLTTIGFDNGECAQAVWRLLKRRLEKVETGPAVREPVRHALVVRKSVK